MRRGNDDCTDESGSRNPVDISALRADDALIDELAAGMVRFPRHRAADPEPPDPEDELLAMLSAWVAEVRPEALLAARGGDAGTAQPAAAQPAAAPATGARSTTTAPGCTAVTGAVSPATAEENGGPRYARQVAMAAVLAVLTSAGLTIGASTAEPGETLWAVSKVFYAPRARSVVAAAEVTSGLQEARTALRQGRSADAALAIVGARIQLHVVRAAEGHDDLAREARMLEAATEDPTLLDNPGSPGDGGTDPGSRSGPTVGSPGSGPTVGSPGVPADGEALALPAPKKSGPGEATEPAVPAETAPGGTSPEGTSPGGTALGRTPLGGIEPGGTPSGRAGSPDLAAILPSAPIRGADDLYTDISTGNPRTPTVPPATGTGTPTANPDGGPIELVDITPLPTVPSGTGTTGPKPTKPTIPPSASVGPTTPAAPTTGSTSGEGSLPDAGTLLDPTPVTTPGPDESPGPVESPAATAAPPATVALVNGAAPTVTRAPGEPGAKPTKPGKPAASPAPGAVAVTPTSGPDAGTATGGPTATADPADSPTGTGLTLAAGESGTTGGIAGEGGTAGAGSGTVGPVPAQEPSVFSAVVGFFASGIDALFGR